MSYKEHPAHPYNYNGVQFRSKLEASWAYAFDKFGIQWEYEPRNTGVGYWLPDFLIQLDAPLLVEVRPIALAQTKLAKIKWETKGKQVLVLTEEHRFLCQVVNQEWTHQAVWFTEGPKLTAEPTGATGLVAFTREARRLAAAGLL